MNKKEDTLEIITPIKQYDDSPRSSMSYDYLYSHQPNIDPIKM
jgi:hypothetical protein